LKNRTNEIGTNKIGTKEIRTREICTNEIRTNEIRTNEIHTNEIRIRSGSPRYSAEFSLSLLIEMRTEFLSTGSVLDENKC
jgi:hypothetical protein